MAIISIGNIDRNLIPIVIGCIFSFFSRLLFTYKDTKLFSHPLVSNIFATVAKYFTIFPFIIFKIQAHKTNNKTIEQINKTNSFIYRDIQGEISKGKWKYILLSAVIFFIQGSILFFTIEVKMNLYLLNILITCIFSYFVFRIKLFKHHYICIALILLTGIILDLICENLQNDISNYWEKVLLRFGREIIFSLHDIVNKYAMQTKFCSVYEISFYTGLIVTVFFGIFSVLSYYYFELDNFQDYLDNFDTNELLVLIAYLVTQLGLYLGALFTNKNNTPCHIFIIYVFGQLAYYMNFSGNSIAVVICLIFILFFSLIFNEIIEINLFGLSENTKKNIMLRADSEIDYLKENTINDENENNTRDVANIELIEDDNGS